MYLKTLLLAAPFVLVACAPSTGPGGIPASTTATTTAPSTAPAPAAGGESATVSVKGMGSPFGWGKKVTKVLEGLDGVTAVAMRFEDAEFDVQFDAAKTNADALCAAVKEAGFEAIAK